MTLRDAGTSAAYREAFAAAERALRTVREADDEDAKAGIEGKSFDELVDRFAQRNAEMELGRPGNRTVG